MFKALSFNSTACRCAGVVGVTAALALASAAPAAGQGADGEATLHRYATDTWRSFAAMTDSASGLPTDRLHVDGTRSAQTSTTNIGSYMWSAVVAEELGIIDHDELVERMSRTIGTLESMERHEESGQFFNWYDHRTGEKLTVWPPSGNPLIPHLSSVDNGWLAAGLQVVRNSVPELEERAGALYDAMDFGFYYVPEQNLIARTYRPSTDELFCCYPQLGETRIGSYIGIGKGEIPPRQYFGPWRAFPDSCEQFGWQEMRPVGFDRRYFGVDVFEGAYRYQGVRITPNNGGSAFEALMVPLFVPEEAWGAGSWRVNHPLWVQAHIHHGLVEAGYGYWGFSPADVPEGGYRAWGVDALGTATNGYPSNEDNTFVDYGYENCRGRTPQPIPSPEEYTNGVVTPHAAFLGLRWAPAATVANLVNLERDFDIYTQWGFRDSVNVDTGTVSPYFLSLDQGMIMAALGNALADDLLRRRFVTPDFERRLRPPMAVEEFNADPRGCTIEGSAGDDEVTGTPGADVICAGAGDDQIDGGGGDDVLYGDDGDDRIAGEDGGDVLYSGTGDDELIGQDGDDVLSAGPGEDALDGGPGADHFEGGAGENTCSDVTPEDTANACN